MFPCSSVFENQEELIRHYVSYLIATLMKVIGFFKNYSKRKVRQFIDSALDVMNF